MEPVRLPNGNLRVPVAFYDEQLGIYGDGMVEIGPDHPEYEWWLAEIKRIEEYASGEGRNRPG